MNAPQRIDWNDVHRKLSAQQLSLDSRSTQSTAQVSEVHHQRARDLAARVAVLNPQGHCWQGLIFLIANERFCLPLANLVEVAPFVRCTPTPGGPPELCGVVQFRGELRSVLDLARILDLPLAAQRSPGYILFARRSPSEIGLRVDELISIETIDPNLHSTIDVDRGPDNRLAYSRTASRATVLQLEPLLARCNC